jgi:hypothetical protein
VWHEVLYLFLDRADLKAIYPNMGRGEGLSRSEAKSDAVQKDERVLTEIIFKGKLD